MNWITKINSTCNKIVIAEYHRLSQLDIKASTYTLPVIHL